MLGGGRASPPSRTATAGAGGMLSPSTAAAAAVDGPTGASDRATPTTLRGTAIPPLSSAIRGSRRRQFAASNGSDHADGGGDHAVGDGGGGDRLPRPDLRLSRPTRGGDGCR